MRTVLAVHPQAREVFGCIAQEPFVRIPAPQGEQRSGRHKRDERETEVWMRQGRAIGTPDQENIWVHVGDRGADMFPFFQACQTEHTDALSGASGSKSSYAGRRGGDRVFSDPSTILAKPSEPSI